MTDVGTEQKEQVKAPVPKAFAPNLDALGRRAKHVPPLGLPIEIRVEPSLFGRRLAHDISFREGPDGRDAVPEGWSRRRAHLGQVELVETTGGLEVLAEAADEVVGNQGRANVGEDVLFERDWREGKDVNAIRFEPRSSVEERTEERKIKVLLGVAFLHRRLRVGIPVEVSSSAACLPVARSPRTYQRAKRP